VYQTLHAIYGKSCLPAIEARIAREELQVVGFFDDVAVRTIDLPEIRALDPDGRSFFNANTPEALAEASRLAAGPERSGDG
jgi:molybdopterin-guanine dinucleotide biosynthesis protein A